MLWYVVDLTKGVASSSRSFPLFRSLRIPPNRSSSAYNKQSTFLMSSMRHAEAQRKSTFSSLSPNVSRPVLGKDCKDRSQNLAFFSPYDGYWRSQPLFYWFTSSLGVRASHVCYLCPCSICLSKALEADATDHAISLGWAPADGGPTRRRRYDAG